MEVYISAIETKADAESVQKQLLAAKSSHVIRVGMFSLGGAAKQSMSVSVDQALEMVEQRAKLVR